MPDGAKSTFTYDSMGRLTNAQSKTSSDANIANFDYSYNNRDVRTSEQKTLGSGSAQTINYTYDSTNQLTGEVSTEATPVIDNSYTYDAAGNRITSAT
ncbi:MAG: hypothetical protein ABI210_13175 [Abditibacteriaceae bacterium]